MNKIDFTDIYKFLVSVGVALIVFSILFPYLIFSGEFTFTLTPDELSNLSPTSLLFIEYQQSYLMQIAKNHLIISIGLFSVGSILTVGGIFGWYQRQQIHDTKEDTETKRAKLDWEKIEKKETREKLIEDLRIYLNSEKPATVERIENPNFDYILAKFTGSKHSLLDLFNYINSYVQSFGYQILLNWKLDSFTYDVVVEPNYSKVSSNKLHRILSIRYAEHSPSREWLEKVLADLWLSSSYYKDFRKIRNVKATLIVISPSLDFGKRIDEFLTQIQHYWQNGISVNILAFPIQKLDKLFMNYQKESEDLFLPNKKDINDEKEIRKVIFEDLFSGVDPDFINELQDKQNELDKLFVMKEHNADFLKRIFLISTPLTLIASGLVWGLYKYSSDLIDLLHRLQIYLGTRNIVVILIPVILIVIVVLYNISIRTNKVSGSLVFTDGSTTIAEFGLYSGTNFRNIKKRELARYPQLMLKTMSVRNIGRKQRITRQNDEFVDEFYSNHQFGIRIDCVSSSGRRFLVDLYPKEPSIYSDETFAQIVYEPID